MFLTGCKSHDYTEESVSANEEVILEVEEADSDKYDVTDENIANENVNTDAYFNKVITFEDDVYSILGYIPDEYQKDKEYSSWFEKYSSYVYCGGTEYDHTVYYLAYIDDDDIPELIEQEIYWYISTWNGYDDGPDNFSRNEVIVGYDEYSGKILTDYWSVSEGINSLIVYSYDKGLIKMEMSVNEDEEGEYNIRGWKINQESYDMINSHIDLENLTYLTYDNCYSQVEILSVMKTGHDTSYSHRYEIVYGDVTWEEAQEICEEKGGYLAVVTSNEELLRIKECCFKDRDEIAACYVGCRGTISGWDQRWILKNNCTRDVIGGGIFIFDYGHRPSYNYLNLDCENEEIDYGFLVYGYDKFNNKFIVNMMMGPNDIVASNPELAGKVGFICEYDE